ncbi:Nucleotide-binding universal stress protein, UspA family [Devosia lucknowensis]|uniref:Nucleotide-binding universal stress protein, UspA family n=1 Tax=Devosia lucknowensis TaxID=1096929 RepID=A0A1Y6GCI7_9HYPH|nr:universal stress protein [Devosia lucknowensis]SMQ85500.1 Nucleotide-binding universal stress protein, UspA family [Devosia lucknowensis]
MFAHIMIAFDGSDLARKALDLGLQMAKPNGSRVTVVTSTDPIETGLGTGGFGTIDAKSLIDKLEVAYSAEASGILKAARAKAVAAGIEMNDAYVPGMRASDAILETAEKLGCDLVVMGSHGRRGLQRLILGSQAAAVLAASKVPVLIVK